MLYIVLNNVFMRIIMTLGVKTLPTKQVTVLFFFYLKLWHRNIFISLEPRVFGKF